MNNRILFVGGLAVVALVVVLAQGFGRDPRAVESPLLHQPAPDFTLEDLEGSRVVLSQLAGKPVVLNFWATWCPPCVAEHASLQRLATRFRGRATFLGVIYQDEPAAIRQFLTERGSWGPALVDPGAHTAIRYGVYGAPETFVLNADGVVVHKIAGQLDEQRLGEILGGLL